MNLNAEQCAAVELIATAPIGVVTGGPGTGKTTCLREAVLYLGLSGHSFGLAAPTGKAARRMTEATGIEASTLHRALGLIPHPQGGFIHRDDADPVPEVLVIDEASMVDLPMFVETMRSREPGHRLLLVGDADQLPSIGVGQVLRDLVQTPEVPTVRLIEVHRSAAESWVCRNAPRVIAGTLPELDACHDFRFHECGTTASAAEAVMSAMAEDPEAQVLAPQYSTPCGVMAMNLSLQRLLNGSPVNSPVQVSSAVSVKLNDRVLQTRNDYELGVRNGDVGTVVGVDLPSDRGAGMLHIDFDGRVVAMRIGVQTADLQLAYAMTVHKSQGSEWDHVVVVCHSAHSHMLTRSLLYTAITRAKKRLTLVGDVKGLKRAVEHGARPRNTLLAERIGGYRDET